MKKATKFKRILSGVLSAVMTVSAVPIVSAHAEENAEPYPYTMFAASSDDGAITVNAGNFCVNGNVATNGTIVSSGNVNVNGTKTESAEESMIFIFDRIDNRYFLASNVDEHDEDYILDEMNININVPTEVQGEATLTGNININNALKALEDVKLYGEVKNTNDSVIFSKYGDIIIESQNVNLNGLVYAPFGSVTIDAQNLNLNNVVIIAESIVLTCPSVNANNSSNASSFVGTTSEPLDIPYDEWQYMKDENENDFPDFFEDYDNWVILKDTDGDHLPDCVEQFLGTDATLVDTDGDMLDDCYEVFDIGTDPTLYDTDSNGVADGDEDFDSDGLTNYQEYIQGTSPWDNDSDSDNLIDGDEVNTYGTNPLEPDTDFDGLNDADEVALGTNPNLPDTDGDGTPDGKEKFDQTYVYDVENKDCAVEQVIVSMEGTGNLQSTMSVKSIMDADVISSGVVGLIGEPFSIETTSDFETATLSFKIDQTKLGDTDFNDLLFLWYDEDNYQFVELDTHYDETSSLVSIQTTHFSRYMVVDKNQWYEAWSKELNYTSNSHEVSACYSVLAVDCSGSMSSNDPITIIPPSSSPYKPVYDCERHKAVSKFVSALDFDDKAAIVTFEDTANVVCELTNDPSTLYWASASFYNGGGTSFDAAIRKSIDVLKNSTGGTRKKIILLSDGQSSVSDAIVKEAADSYIKIYTIGLGSSSYDSVLEEIASKTGGEFFKAYTADDLLDIYTNMGFEDDFDKTDTDGDGLYDAVEAAGIRIQNGMILRNNPETDTFFSNPAVPDTDNDGLTDGQEIDPTIRWKLGSSGKREYYFFMKSDPSSKDSDGDGFVDNYCNKTKDDAVYGFSDPNPLTSDVTKTELEHDFFSVDYEYNEGVEKDWRNNNSGKAESYGGYQGWFGRYGYTQNEKMFCNATVTGLDIHNNGCGIIALGDMLMYMAIGDPTYNPTMNWSIPSMLDLGSSYEHIDFDLYVLYIYMVSNYFTYLPVIDGVAGDGLLLSNLENGLYLMSINNSMNLKTIEWQYSSNSDKTLKLMKEMLNNEIPVIFSCNATFKKNKLPLYRLNEDKEYVEDQKVGSHFMDATAIIDFSSDVAELVGHSRMIKTATYGKEYYVDFNEFADRLSWDTNILYVEK